MVMSSSMRVPSIYYKQEPIKMRRHFSLSQNLRILGSGLCRTPFKKIIISRKQEHNDVNNLR